MQATENGETGEGGAFAPVLEAVRSTGWTSTVLDLDGVGDKAAFLGRCADALALPGWTGRNWDALADSLKDLSWLPVARGRLLLVARWRGFADAAPADWRAAQDVFASAEAHWRGRAEGFAVLLSVDTGR
ncbi:barstar family protein [Streptomyces sp. NPDC050560]|uniref:barstar family protein n=1 Tax=Streptomyces sp. NPDC050560 TaxID=3365630 RepID=UPI0037B4E2AE